MRARGGEDVKIAIVDDDAAYRRLLRAFAEQFARENGEMLEIVTAANGAAFWNDYQADCQVIFLDVEMPLMDGIATARMIRKVDQTVQIIFLTNYSQYAINGYEVNALDYVMKPLTYFAFAQKFKKALAFADRHADAELIIRNEHGVIRLKAGEILWVDSEKNYTVYHTAKGKYRERATMRDTMQRLAHMSFAASTAGCLVNLAYVRKVVEYDVYIGEHVLPLSRGKKKDFMEKYIHYLTQGGER